MAATSQDEKSFVPQEDVEPFSWSATARNIHILK